MMELDARSARHGCRGTVVVLVAVLASALAARAEATTEVPLPDNVGLHDAGSGRWFLRAADGALISLLYGNPADSPFMGDWDCDGTATPGLYRPSDGKVYLRNSLTTGIADVEYFFGDPGDVPVAGDFDGDGCDTVAIYRPATNTFHIKDSLGAGNRGIGASDRVVVVDAPGGIPLAGDFHGTGLDSPGLHDRATGRFVLVAPPGGDAAAPFTYGNAADQALAGDWDGDGTASIGVFRPATGAFHLRNTNDPGPADTSWSFGDGAWAPLTWNPGPLRLDVAGAADPESVPPTGGPVRVDITVANRSAAATLRLTELRDDGDGDGATDRVLDPVAACDAPVLGPGAVATCALERTVAGPPGTTVPGTVTVTASDGRGARISASHTQGVHVRSVRNLDGFSTEIVATGLSSLTSLAFLPDGRMLVLDKRGEITIGDLSGGLPAATEPYMTIANIDAEVERGLLDITLDPDFEANRFLYVYYTPAAPARARVARFTHVEHAGGTSSRGDLASEVVVWEDTDGYLTCCHYGAGLDFGPDGNLWVTPGDRNRPAEIPQDLTRSGGKVLRIAPDGSVPPGNPFADGAGGNHDYVFAVGLRNPFRARWDATAGDVHAGSHGLGRLFVGEVGSDNTVGWEDVHVLTLEDAGANFGWPHCEGLAATLNPDFPTCPDHLEPAFAYPHAGEGASLTGGLVYRGGQFPPEWHGVYFYADFVRSWIRYLEFDAAGEVVVADHAFAPTGEIPIAPFRITVLDVGPDGALYYGQHGGTVRRVVYAAGNEPPEIEFSASPTSGATPLEVEFQARALDPERAPLSYRLDFGDGTPEAAGAVLPDGTIPPTRHVYAVPGPYAARLEVSDGDRTTISPEIDIAAGSPPVATIARPQDEQRFVAGESFDLAGSCSATPNPCTLAWTIRFGHNEHFHPELGPVEGSGISWAVPRAGHDFAETTWFEIALTATDAVTGLTGTHVIEIRPDKVAVTFAAPPGLVLVVDGRARLAPFTLDSLRGFDHRLEAPSPQCAAQVLHEFVAWSDGSGREHVFRVPNSATTLTATYRSAGAC